MIKRQGFSSLALIIIILIILGGGYWVWQNQLESEASKLAALSADINIEPSVTPSTPSVDTTDWRIYSNEEYGFEFKYPPNLDINSAVTISVPMTGNPKEIITLRSNETLLTDSGRSFDGFAIYVIPNQSQNSINSNLENEKTAQLNAKISIDGNNISGIQSSFTLNNRQGKILRGYSWDDIERFYVSLNGQDILVLAKLDQKEGSFDKIFDQILSTFRFTK